MKKLVSLCVFTLVIVPAAMGAVETKSGVTSSGKPKFTATDKVTAQATVLSVNKTKRIVTVRNADGDTVAIECDSRVKNFAQIHPNDVVNVAYTEKLTVEVGAGEPGSSADVSTTTAKPGAKPKAEVTQTVKYKATITAIDKAKGTATLKGEDGHETTITPRNPANLDKVKVGELVVFTYTEALAVSITKPATAAK